MIHVEVIYATDKNVEIVPLSVEPGSTVLSAINQSGIISKFPDINLDFNKVGIFSKLCNLDTVVNDGDRLEVYRPLKADPKDARRMRADRQKKV
jgi:putative ubiquitin-RnfH superfamily antitoxin RatB of RatAB toxin-antitoxin module